MAKTKKLNKDCRDFAGEIQCDKSKHCVWDFSDSVCLPMSEQIKGKFDRIDKSKSFKPAASSSIRKKKPISPAGKKIKPKLKPKPPSRQVPDDVIPYDPLIPIPYNPMTSSDCKRACGDRVDPDNPHEITRAVGGKLLPQDPGRGSCYQLCMNCAEDPTCNYFGADRGCSAESGCSLPTDEDRGCGDNHYCYIGDEINPAACDASLEENIVIAPDLDGDGVPDWGPVGCPCDMLDGYQVWTISTVGNNEVTFCHFNNDSWATNHGGAGVVAPGNCAPFWGWEDLADVPVCSDDAVYGCMDMDACNYNADATADDGSCEYPQENYDCDGNCTAIEYICDGSTESDAVCPFTVEGVGDTFCSPSVYDNCGPYALCFEITGCSTLNACPWECEEPYVCWDDSTVCLGDGEECGEYGEEFDIVIESSVYMEINPNEVVNMPLLSENVTGYIQFTLGLPSGSVIVTDVILTGTYGGSAFPIIQVNYDIILTPDQANTLQGDCELSCTGTSLDVLECIESCIEGYVVAFEDAHSDESDPPDVVFTAGCTNPVADNYDPSAVVENGSCIISFECYNPYSPDGLGSYSGDGFGGTTPHTVSNVDDCYDSVQLADGRRWFAQNNFQIVYSNGDFIGTHLVGAAGWAGYEGQPVCASVAYSDLSDAGVLYNMNAIMGGNVCPYGWHVPVYEELVALIDAHDCDTGDDWWTDCPGYPLKRGTDTDWFTSPLISDNQWMQNFVPGGCGPGCDSTGFNADPSGVILETNIPPYDHDFQSTFGRYWGGIPYDVQTGYGLSFEMNQGYVLIESYLYHSGLAVRCVEDIGAGAPQQDSLVPWYFGLEEYRAGLMKPVQLCMFTDECYVYDQDGDLESMDDGWYLKVIENGPLLVKDEISKGGLGWMSLGVGKPNNPPTTTSDRNSYTYPMEHGECPAHPVFYPGGVDYWEGFSQQNVGEMPWGCWRKTYYPKPTQNNAFTDMACCDGVLAHWGNHKLAWNQQITSCYVLDSWYHYNCGGCSCTTTQNAFAILAIPTTSSDPGGGATAEYHADYGYSYHRTKNANGSSYGLGPSCPHVMCIGGTYHNMYCGEVSAGGHQYQIDIATCNDGGGVCGAGSGCSWGFKWGQGYSPWDSDNNINYQTVGWNTPDWNINDYSCCPGCFDPGAPNPSSDPSCMGMADKLNTLDIDWNQRFGWEQVPAGCSQMESTGECSGEMIMGPVFQANVDSWSEYCLAICENYTDFTGCSGIVSNDCGFLEKDVKTCEVEVAPNFCSALNESQCGLWEPGSDANGTGHPNHDAWTATQKAFDGNTHPDATARDAIAGGMQTCTVNDDNHPLGWPSGTDYPCGFEGLCYYPVDYEVNPWGGCCGWSKTLGTCVYKGCETYNECARRCINTYNIDNNHCVDYCQNDQALYLPDTIDLEDGGGPGSDGIHLINSTCIGDFDADGLCHEGETYWGPGGPGDANVNWDLYPECQDGSGGVGVRDCTWVCNGDALVDGCDQCICPPDGVSAGPGVADGNVCTGPGSNQEGIVGQFNRDDVGCGCDAPGPITHYWDEDGDGYPTTEIGDFFCLNMNNRVTSNSCNELYPIGDTNAVEATNYVLLTGPGNNTMCDNNFVHGTYGGPGSNNGTAGGILGDWCNDGTGNPATCEGGKECCKPCSPVGYQDSPGTPSDVFAGWCSSGTEADIYGSCPCDIANVTLPPWVHGDTLKQLPCNEGPGFSGCCGCLDYPDCAFIDNCDNCIAYGESNGCRADVGPGFPAPGTYVCNVAITDFDGDGYADDPNPVISRPGGCVLHSDGKYYDWNGQYEIFLGGSPSASNECRFSGCDNYCYYADSVPATYHYYADPEGDGVGGPADPTPICSTYVGIGPGFGTQGCSQYGNLYGTGYCLDGSDPDDTCWCPEQNYDSGGPCVDCNGDCLCPTSAIEAGIGTADCHRHITEGPGYGDRYCDAGSMSSGCAVWDPHNGEGWCGCGSLDCGAVGDMCIYGGTEIPSGNECQLGCDSVYYEFTDTNWANPGGPGYLDDCLICGGSNHDSSDYDCYFLGPGGTYDCWTVSCPVLADVDNIANAYTTNAEILANCSYEEECGCGGTSLSTQLTLDGCGSCGDAAGPGWIGDAQGKLCSDITSTDTICDGYAGGPGSTNVFYDCGPGHWCDPADPFYTNGPGSNDIADNCYITDCAGTCNGIAECDECGFCTGPGTLTDGTDCLQTDNVGIPQQDESSNTTYCFENPAGPGTDLGSLTSPGGYAGFCCFNFGTKGCGCGHSAPVLHYKDTDGDTFPDFPVETQMYCTVGDHSNDTYYKNWDIPDSDKYCGDQGGWCPPTGPGWPASSGCGPGGTLPCWDYTALTDPADDFIGPGGIAGCPCFHPTNEAYPTDYYYETCDPTGVLGVKSSTGFVGCCGCVDYDSAGNNPVDYGDCPVTDKCGNCGGSCWGADGAVECNPGTCPGGNYDATDGCMEYNIVAVDDCAGGCSCCNVDYDVDDDCVGPGGNMDTGPGSYYCDAATLAYYPDVDGDGLGDSSCVSTAICSGNDTTGYVLNCYDPEDDYGVCTTNVYDYWGDCMPNGFGGLNLAAGPGNLWGGPGLHDGTNFHVACGWAFGPGGSSNIYYTTNFSDSFNGLRYQDGEVSYDVGCGLPDMCGKGVGGDCSANDCLCADNSFHDASDEDDCINICSGLGGITTMFSCDPCTKDCLGAWGGSAVVDDCGVCDGPGIPAGQCCTQNDCQGPGDCDGNVLDDCGECEGGNVSCADCNGNPDGEAYTFPGGGDCNNVCLCAEGATDGSGPGTCDVSDGYGGLLFCDIDCRYDEGDVDITYYHLSNVEPDFAEDTCGDCVDCTGSGIACLGLGPGSPVYPDLWNADDLGCGCNAGNIIPERRCFDSDGDGFPDHPADINAAPYNNSGTYGVKWYCDISASDSAPHVSGDSAIIGPNGPGCTPWSPGCDTGTSVGLDVFRPEDDFEMDCYDGEGAFVPSCWMNCNSFVESPYADHSAGVGNGWDGKRISGPGGTEWDFGSGPGYYYSCATNLTDCEGIICGGALLDDCGVCNGPGIPNAGDLYGDVCECAGNNGTPGGVFPKWDMCGNCKWDDTLESVPAACPGGWNCGCCSNGYRATQACVDHLGMDNPNEGLCLCNCPTYPNGTGSGMGTYDAGWSGDTCNDSFDWCGVDGGNNIIQNDECGTCACDGPGTIGSTWPNWGGPGNCDECAVCGGPGIPDGTGPGGAYVYGDACDCGTTVFGCYNSGPSTGCDNSEWDECGTCCNGESGVACNDDRTTFFATAPGLCVDGNCCTGPLGPGPGILSLCSTEAGTDCGTIGGSTSPTCCNLDGGCMAGAESDVAIDAWTCYCGPQTWDCYNDCAGSNTNDECGVCAGPGLPVDCDDGNGNMNFQCCSCDQTGPGVGGPGTSHGTGYSREYVCADSDGDGMGHINNSQFTCIMDAAGNLLTDMSGLGHNCCTDLGPGGCTGSGTTGWCGTTNASNSVSYGTCTDTNPDTYCLSDTLDCSGICDGPGEPLSDEDCGCGLGDYTATCPSNAQDGGPGSTGIYCCGPGTTCDCQSTCGGSVEIDHCGVCGGDNTTCCNYGYASAADACTCYAVNLSDDAGTAEGDFCGTGPGSDLDHASWCNVQYDICAECNGPGVGKTCDEPCCGIGGADTTCGCDNDCGSTAAWDDCGVCGGPGHTASCPNGSWCGVDGPGPGATCNGAGATCGCDNVCGSTTELDNCSNCGGPGGAACWDGTVCCSDSSCDCRGFDGCGGTQVDDCAGACNGPGAEFTCNVDGSMCGPGGCAPNGTIGEVCDDYLTTCPDGTGCCDDALCGCGNVCGVNDETFTCGATDYECTISDDACAASIADVCGPYLNDTNNCCTDVVMDCAGSCGGSATDDDCGCNEGAYTGTCPNTSPCCGPGSGCDCDNNCGGDLEIDDCGICGGPGYPSACADGSDCCETSCDCRGVAAGCGGDYITCPGTSAECCATLAQCDHCGVCDGNGCSCETACTYNTCTNEGLVHNTYTHSTSCTICRGAGDCDCTPASTINCNDVAGGNRNGATSGYCGAGVPCYMDIINVAFSYAVYCPGGMANTCWPGDPNPSCNGTTADCHGNDSDANWWINSGGKAIWGGCQIDYIPNCSGPNADVCVPQAALAGFCDDGDDWWFSYRSLECYCSDCCLCGGC